ncbi:transporter [Maricurvus nonylphenolicus]|uniref:hypothetical protein n=1 Tax=Maricurvus nonylphenolicus TaxID=1008307 RepID=UPI0036F39377
MNTQIRVVARAPTGFTPHKLALAISCLLAFNATTLSAAGAAQGSSEIERDIRQLKAMNQALMTRVQYLEQRLRHTEHAPEPGYPVNFISERDMEFYRARGLAGLPAAAASAAGGQPPSDVQKLPQGEVTQSSAPSSSRGIDDLVSEAHALFDQSWTFEIGYEYTNYDRSQLVLNGFLALDAIFLGNISIDETSSEVFKTTFSTRWGITPKVQLSLDVPYLFRETTIRSGGQELASTVRTEDTVSTDDLGDITFGISYQLMDETWTRPDMVLNFSVTAPTGQDPYGIKFVDHPDNTNLKMPESLPTGTGLWSTSIGLSLLKTADPALFFTNIAYKHYFEESFDDLSTNPLQADDPADVKLGDELQLSLGIAFAINERTSMSMWFTQRFFEAAEITRGDITQEIVGSDTRTGHFDVGVTYALSERLSVVTDMGIGLTNDSSDYKFAVKFPYRF